MYHKRGCMSQMIHKMTYLQFIAGLREVEAADGCLCLVAGEVLTTLSSCSPEQTGLRQGECLHLLQHVSSSSLSMPILGLQQKALSTFCNCSIGVSWSKLLHKCAMLSSHNCLAHCARYTRTRPPELYLCLTVSPKSIRTSTRVRRFLASITSMNRQSCRINLKQNSAHKLQWLCEHILRPICTTLQNSNHMKLTHMKLTDCH